MSCPAPLSITGLLDPAADVLAEVSDHLYGQLLAWLLIAVGIWFTVRTRGLQFRLFGQMLRAIAGSRASSGGISSFQAFTIGLASRVGTGNIVGVAALIGAVEDRDPFEPEKEDGPFSERLMELMGRPEV